jgi:hypothetical protein
MLRSTNVLKGYAIEATDGEIGLINNFFFDDEAWFIRYFVVDTGSWLSSRKVLISPIAVGQPNLTQRSLRVSITMEQVKSSPSIDTEKPVSRQHELRYAGYYGYPFFWEGYGLPGMGANPSFVMSGISGIPYAPHGDQIDANVAYTRVLEERRLDGDPHLRSCSEVMTYHIQATDGEIGHVHGLLVEAETWAVRYIIVSTSNWWIGHQVLVSPLSIESVYWRDRMVSVNLSRKAIREAPSFDATAVLDLLEPTEN